uniref:Cytochrome P450 n=1 Tax=Oryza brachyantha TaxID=4533 RepID=J3MM49_ORYBR
MGAIGGGRPEARARARRDAHRKQVPVRRGGPVQDARRGPDAPPRAQRQHAPRHHRLPVPPDPGAPPARQGARQARRDIRRDREVPQERRRRRSRPPRHAAVPHRRQVQGRARHDGGGGRRDARLGALRGAAHELQHQHVDRRRLLTHPEHLRAAVREQEELVRRQPQAAVDHRALQRMEHLHRCIKETLRLHPPSLMLLRYARRSFTVRTRDGAAEYEVPAGHTVASPMVLHNALPHVYEDAGAFDPGRFAPGREEDRAYGADHAYTAFGGGRHAAGG